MGTEGGIFIACCLIILAFGIGWTSSCSSHFTRQVYVSDWMKTPYCVDKSATVLGKTIHNKRCWKAVEVDPP